jgi:antirestriction protein ArdC
MKEKFDIYSMINNKIIERLENGVVPWNKPWDATTDTPINLISKKPYKGVNFWMLNMLHDQPYYLSYNQLTQQGGTLKKGAERIQVVFWKMKIYENTDDQGEVSQKKIPVLLYYTVYNVKDIEGLPEKLFPAEPEKREFKPIQACKNIVENWEHRPVVKHGGAGAYYTPGLDYVQMPQPQNFRSGEEYYSTLFHELVHSTGHHSRLDRHRIFKNHNFGSKDYSQEELVAEMGASYLCGITGIENKTINNSAAYIKSWLKRLQDDKKLFFNAASMAQKAVDYMTLSSEE